MMRNSSFVLGLLVLALSVAPSTTRAQCVGDDGFQMIPGTCCLPATPTLPIFPSIVIPSNGGCIRSCTNELTWNANIALGAPFPVFCDLYVAPITIFSATSPTTTSFLVMKYARTWSSFTTAGTVNQVWRFLINTDLTFTGGAMPCPIPPCASLFNQVHYIGSMDYSLDCGTNVWAAAINLTHHCEEFSHTPGSQRPVAGPAAHSDRTYAFAGPAPFLFGPVPPTIGPVIGDSQRSTDANLNLFIWNCMTETPIVNGGIFPVNQRCLCPDPSIPSQPRWTDYQVNFAYGCSASLPNQFTPIPVAPSLPTGMIALSLGRYALPFGTFPGPQSVETWFGVASAPDPCSSAFSLPFHIVHGVSTQGGDIGITFPNGFGTTATTDKFIDFENMLVFNSSVPSGLFIGYGGIFLGTQIWSMNVP